MRDERSTFFGNSTPVLLGVVKIGFHDLLEDLRDCVSVERGESAEEDVGDHSDAPHIDLLAVATSVQHLRGCVDVSEDA